MPKKSKKRSLSSILANPPVAAQEGVKPMATQDLPFANSVHLTANVEQVFPTSPATGFVVPAGQISATIDTASIPSGAVVTIAAEISLDGGNTWRFDWGATMQGGTTGTPPSSLHGVSTTWPACNCRIRLKSTQSGTISASGVLTF